MTTTEPVFVVNIAITTELDVDSIWPTGDPPHHPTPRDVIAHMRHCALSPWKMARDWDLSDLAVVTVAGPDGTTAEWTA